MFRARYGHSCFIGCSVGFSNYVLTVCFAMKVIGTMLTRYALGLFLSAAMLLSSAALADADGGDQRLVPNDMRLCAANAQGPAALVLLHGFKDRTGNIRIQTYSDRQEDLLEKGKYVNRIVTAVTPSGGMSVCVPFPAPGRYVVFVQHDRNANGSLGTSDGAAFSNNPRLRFGLPKPPKPSAKEAAIDVSGIVKTQITLNYLSGFSIKPVENPEN